MNSRCCPKTQHPPALPQILGSLKYLAQRPLSQISLPRIPHPIELPISTPQLNKNPSFVWGSGSRKRYEPYICEVCRKSQPLSHIQIYLFGKLSRRSIFYTSLWRWRSVCVCDAMPITACKQDETSKVHGGWTSYFVYKMHCVEYKNYLEKEKITLVNFILGM